MNSFIIFKSLTYIKDKYSFISSISSFIYYNLVKRQYNDRKLIKALDIKDFQVIDLLIEHVNDPSILNYYLLVYSSIEIEQVGKKQSVLKLLIKNGADIHYENDSLLINSCKANHNYSFIKYLIDKGADVNVQDGQPMCYISRYNRDDLVELFINSGATFTHYEPLNEALYHGSEKVFLFLMKNKIYNVDEVIYNLCKDDMASYWIKLLIKKGYKISKEAINRANENNSFNIIEILLRNDPSLADEDILLNVSNHNKFEVTKLIIDKVDISRIKNELLQACATYGNYDIIDSLLKDITDVPINIKNQLTLSSIKHGRLDIFELFKNECDLQCEELLNEAIKYYRFDIIQIIIKKKTIEELIIKANDNYDIIDFLKTELSKI
jgi:hypothetical protein